LASFLLISRCFSLPMPLVLMPRAVLAFYLSMKCFSFMRVSNGVIPLNIPASTSFLSSSSLIASNRLTLFLYPLLPVLTNAHLAALMLSSLNG
jgi:hypothetical protein